jgi:hypothetical protein
MRQLFSRIVLQIRIRSKKAQEIREKIEQAAAGYAIAARLGRISSYVKLRDSWLVVDIGTDVKNAYLHSSPTIRENKGDQSKGVIARIDISDHVYSIRSQ